MKKVKKFKINNIRSKLVTSLMGICIIPLLILGYGANWQAKSILNDKLKVTSQQTLSEVNSGIDNYFEGFNTIITMLSNNYNFVNADKDEPYSFIPSLLKNVKDSNNDIFSTYLGTEDGKFLIYPNQKMPDGFNHMERPWYKQAIENKGKVIVTLPFKDAQTGKSVVAIAKTIEREGKIVGVCSMNVSLDTLTEKISSKKIGLSGYIFVADVEGKSMIAHPNKELIDTDVASKQNFWNEVKTSEKGFLTYTFNNAQKFGVYETNPLTGWKLVATLDEKEITDDTKSILTTTLIIILAIGIVSVVLSLFLSKSISNNIKNLKNVFEKAARGDLTVKIKASTKDEFMDLANSFNEMIGNISTLMSNAFSSSKTVLETSANLASMSEEVTASIGEVAKAIQEVSEGATNQAQNAQNSAEEMNDLANSLDKISENTSEMDSLSINTKNLGDKGLSLIDALIDKSNKTKMSTSEVNDIVKDMNDSTKKINNISETIVAITEQTNLLALNASIESARAGEAGKGFAVVAEEIRKLAEQSKNSTEEIKVIISNIQTKSDTAVNAIKQTEEIVIEQETAVGKTQGIFNEILKAIESMIKKVEEVKWSTQDMNQKKLVVVSEIENISSISQETASVSEEVTASTEEITAVMDRFTNHADELQLLAEKLATELNNFKINN